MAFYEQLFLVKGQFTCPFGDLCNGGVDCKNPALQDHLDPSANRWRTKDDIDSEKFLAQLEAKKASLGEKSQTPGS